MKDVNRPFLCLSECLGHEERGSGIVWSLGVARRPLVDAQHLTEIVRIESGDGVERRAQCRKPSGTQRQGRPLDLGRKGAVVDPEGFDLNRVAPLGGEPEDKLIISASP